MSHHCLIITFSWFGSASLQYINTGGSGADNALPLLNSPLQYPIPYINLVNTPNDADDVAIRTISPEYIRDEPVQRKRRTVEDDREQKNWLPSSVDTDKTLYMQNEELIPTYHEHNDDGNRTVEKKNFSPWGGKRDAGIPSFEHMWTWKRTSGVREPSMPKRVRFSPWGGKRSGQMIYKPGNKGSKVIFSSSVPELTRIVSKYTPRGDEFHVTGFQFIPGMDKRHPIKILALSTKIDDRTMREALPFKTFLESLPKMFKPGHPYHDVQLKKDGKRKVKFSAWGGKRSPPVIGPIWTPAPHDLKETTLNSILLIREERDREKSM